MVMKGEKEYKMNLKEKEELRERKRGYVEKKLRILKKWYEEWRKMKGEVKR